MRTKLLALAGLLVSTMLLAPAAPAHGAASPESDAPPVMPYSLLQMNLCLSGLAGCFGRTQYPIVVDEAIERIVQTRPNAVTLNEACSGDVERIARATGMQFRFSTVIYGGAPLPCTRPGERGVFGNGVLTRMAIVETTDQAYVAQLGSEERRWMCVTSADGVRVCVTHLAVAGSVAARANNEAQCAELSRVMATGDEPSILSLAPSIIGGDVNRQASCAAVGYWTERDAAASQAVGIQHAYGTSARLLLPTASVLPMTYTDHDALLVRALLAPTLEAGIDHVADVAYELAASREVQPSAARDVAALVSAAATSAAAGDYTATIAALSTLEGYLTSSRAAKVSAAGKSALLSLMSSWLGTASGLRAFSIALAAEADAGRVAKSTAHELQALTSAGLLDLARSMVSSIGGGKVSEQSKLTLMPLLDAAILAPRPQASAAI